jgi:hypothetical protein
VLTTDALPFAESIDNGYAEAKFNNGTSVELPVEVWSNKSHTVESTNKSFLSLGPHSSFTSSLLRLGKIPSKLTGYYHGSRSIEKATDGELIVGGWDRARINGSMVNYTIAKYRMDIPCSLVVKVKAFTLGNHEGSFPILDPGTERLACIDPMQNAFTLPSDLFARWANVTRLPLNSAPHGPLDYQTYPKANEDLIGSLSIELEGGYTTEIPHHELVTQQRGPLMSENGAYTVDSNATTIMSAVNMGPVDYGDDFGILLGGVFLSNNYLIIDWDNGVFRLAPVTDHGQVGPANIQTGCSTGHSTVIDSNYSRSSRLSILGFIFGIFAIYAILRRPDRVELYSNGSVSLLGLYDRKLTVDNGEEMGSVGRHSSKSYQMEREDSVPPGQRRVLWTCVSFIQTFSPTEC